MSCAEFGKFLNTPYGYSLHKLRDDPWGWWWSVTVYEARIVEPNPFMWEAPNGRRIKMGPKFETDGCSVPPVLQLAPWLSPDRFLLTGLMHDFGCKYGGMFIQEQGSDAWPFVHLTRLDMDNLLRLWVGAEGGNAVQRGTFFRGVRTGALFQRHPLIGYWDELPPGEKVLAT